MGFLPLPDRKNYIISRIHLFFCHAFQILFFFSCSSLPEPKKKKKTSGKKKIWRRNNRDKARYTNGLYFQIKHRLNNNNSNRFSIDPLKNCATRKSNVLLWICNFFFLLFGDRREFCQRQVNGNLQSKWKEEMLPHIFIHSWNCHINKTTIEDLYAFVFFVFHFRVNLIPITFI